MYLEHFSSIFFMMLSDGLFKTYLYRHDKSIIMAKLIPARTADVVICGSIYLLTSLSTGMWKI